MTAPRILLGVSGGIAAYKAADLVRALVKAGAEVQVILTEAARSFVTPMTLATLSGRPVRLSEFDDPASPEIGHIELARWGDALVVAPATANTLARFARGLADDLLSAVYLAFDGPVVVAPAMNPKMWDHPETRASIERLGHRGVTVIEPEEGLVACGDEGAGRLAPLERIAEAALAAARRRRSLAGIRVVVTAGPTWEPIDPVRYVGNRSSGKMGYAIAAAARARGAEVVLISGPCALAPPWGVRVVPVETAAQMREAVLAEAAGAGVVVMAAAVADHRPAEPAAEKISRKGRPFSLSLEPNPDILTELCRRREPGQVIVGFAAETGDAERKGREKRARKGCDLIAVNDVAEAGSGFGTDTNRITLIDGEGRADRWPLLPKRAAAERLLDAIEARLGRGDAR
ncbi:MAG: bifunctional phosphopantothenoylcysteine decarboxylase/phosphopantothenate--cysteine ligase CoaBC [Acidobacteria bacterium]|nr:MAG: bifunctional phosphopantothenoylcysteine decarboxylase/phosphopantothenate--cysteine ligase CoaBC [Acidobacteriota bacterium]